MTDIVERLRDKTLVIQHPEREQIADEIERLQGLLRGTGANRYWEGRWRDDRAEIEELRKTVQHLQITLENMEKIA